MKSLSEENANQNMQEDLISMILEYEIGPLLKKMKENSKMFSFISDRKFSTRGGKLNMNCLKIDSRVSSELKLYSKIIERIKKFKDYPLCQDVQQKIYICISSLVYPAIEFGFCEQGEELLKMLKDPELVGIFNDTDIKTPVLKIVENYAKRRILEGDLEIKGLADQLMVDVVSGCFGKDTQKNVSIDLMQKVYDTTTVEKGDMIFKVDGSNFWRSEVKDKLF